jgi:DMSO/TMAO reductase YedYZ molybdopterin-dependent catalytic subunit
MSMDRRRFLALGATSLGAMVLGACDSHGPAAARGALRFAMRENEGVERFLFRHTSMDHPATERLVGGAFPSYYVSRGVPTWDAARMGEWALEVSGLVRHPLRLTCRS